MRAGAPAGERRGLQRADSREQAATRFLAATRGGVGGMIDDYLLCTRDWGFRVADVKVPVQVWHGVRDEIVPLDAAMHTAAELPRAQTALDPDEGHFFYERRLREILGDLTAVARAEGTRVPLGGPPRTSPPVRGRRA